MESKESWVDRFLTWFAKVAPFCDFVVAVAIGPLIVIGLIVWIIAGLVVIF